MRSRLCSCRSHVSTKGETMRTLRLVLLLVLSVALAGGTAYAQR